MNHYLSIIVAFCLLTVAKAEDVNILDYGAIPGGTALCTEAIQEAIDHCSETGGGTVTVPPGSYLVHTIYLKSHVNLHLAKGATILADTHPQAFDAAILYGENIQDAVISGFGVINGQGFASDFPTSGHRPNNIRLYRCKNMRVSNVTLYNSPVWNFRILQCDGVMVQGVRIYSFANENNDGINIDGKNITLSGCIVDCDDDAICFKSQERDYVTENVTVTNCVIASNCNAIKMGTASYGGFKNITISNCVIRRPSEAPIRSWGSIQGVTSDTTVISGIALEIVDGGVMDQVSISNISMQGVQTLCLSGWVTVVEGGSEKLRIPHPAC